jgi:plasmid stabilization system protein ParE
VKFVVRSVAREDILRQFEYYLVEKNAATAANRFLVAVQAAIEQLCRQPEIGVPKRLPDAKLAGLRSWPVKGFSDIRVYYLVSDGVLCIVRVLHGKREIDRLLEGVTAVES